MLSMVLAVRQHACDDLALFGDAQALVGTQLFEIDFVGHWGFLGLSPEA